MITLNYFKAAVALRYFPLLYKGIYEKGRFFRNLLSDGSVINILAS